MKKNIFAMAVLALFVSQSARAAESTPAPDFTWAGVNAGVKSAGVEAGAGWVIKDSSSVVFAVGGEVNIISKNGRTVLIPTAVGMISNGDNGEPVLLFKSGYAPQTGAVAGVDVAFPLFFNHRTAIKIGGTAFRNRVDGARGIVHVGLIHSF